MVVDERGEEAACRPGADAGPSSAGATSQLSHRRRGPLGPAPPPTPAHPCLTSISFYVARWVAHTVKGPARLASTRQPQAWGSEGWSRGKSPSRVAVPVSRGGSPPRLTRPERTALETPDFNRLGSLGRPYLPPFFVFGTFVKVHKLFSG